MLNKWWEPLTLDRYGRVNGPLDLGSIPRLTVPAEDQYILRMLVRAPYSYGTKLPEQLLWLESVLQLAEETQDQIGVRHPFCYVTVRHGPVTSVLDDVWHVDGFSARYHHLPDSNYIFCLGEKPTEYANQSFRFPADFNPLRHNIHTFFQRRVQKECIRSLYEGNLYMLDPYVVHRRPPETRGLHRTFVRISYTMLEIPDVNNTRNPLIPTPHYVMDGVKEWRDLLLDYDEVYR